MQGRLSKSNEDNIQSFPVNSWKQEFEIAKKCGFEVMEWVFDDTNNPILFSENISEIISLCRKSNIQINSICADYFMERKLFSESKKDICENIKILEKLIIQSKKLGISMIEIPLVDSSSLNNNDDKIEFIKNIRKIIYLLEKMDIILVLETDLPPNEFRDLLLKFNHPKILANYDSGNSASLGYNTKEEFNLIKKWVKNVHVKDRKIHGGTVVLGNGDTNFDIFFESLEKIMYSGDLIIQGARDENSTPEQTCSKYKKFVEECLNKYYKY